MAFESIIRSNIVKAAVAMNASGVDFASFKESRCNQAYWQRTEDGGFQLKPGAASSAGIRDIYAQGHLYAFECAVAMVIILYQAILDSIGEDSFNLYFADLFLHDWHYDSNLRLITVNNKKEAQPGDILYFMNPDYPRERPEWQGENVVLLGNHKYFGHGIGIKTAEETIAFLNKYRRTQAKRSAYLVDQITYPDFIGLEDVASGKAPLYTEWRQHRLVPRIMVKIGAAAYLR